METTSVNLSLQINGKPFAGTLKPVEMPPASEMKIENIQITLNSLKKSDTLSVQPQPKLNLAKEVKLFKASESKISNQNSKDNPFKNPVAAIGISAFVGGVFGSMAGIGYNFAKCSDKVMPPALGLALGVALGAALGTAGYLKNK